MIEPHRTPLGELFMTDPPPCAGRTPDGPCADHAAQPGDEELAKVLMKMWGDQIATRCVNPKTMLVMIRHD